MLRTSAELADRCGDERQEAWSLSVLARAHLLRDERVQGADALVRSIALCELQRWLAFLPWPVALRAELDLRSGSADVVTDAADRAWSLSCRLGDPCWEGMTARVHALACAQRGALGEASEWLNVGRQRCAAVTDMYQWVRLYVLDASIEVARLSGDIVHARQFTEMMASIAARCEMGEMIVRTHLHRWRLGERGALDAALLLSIDIDNPALHREIELARSGGTA